MSCYQDCWHYWPSWLKTLAVSGVGHASSWLWRYMLAWLGSNLAGSERLKLHYLPSNTRSLCEIFSFFSLNFWPDLACRLCQHYASFALHYSRLMTPLYIYLKLGSTECNAKANDTYRHHGTNNANTKRLVTDGRWYVWKSAHWPNLTYDHWTLLLYSTLFTKHNGST